MYLFYFIMYSGKCILEDHTESSWFYNSGLDSGSQTNTPSPAHFVCLPHLSHLIQLISSLVQTARPGGASQFLFVHHPFLSSYLSSTPSGCEERVHGKNARRRDWIRWNDISSVAPFSVTSELTSCAKWICPCVLKVCFKTFEINNKAI